MPGFHAGWSIGTVVGAATGALAAHGDLDPTVHFALASLVLAGAALVAVRVDARGHCRRTRTPRAPRASTTCPGRPVR